MARDWLMPNVVTVSEMGIETEGLFQFRTLQMRLMFRQVAEQHWAHALAWNYDMYTPAQVDVLGAASLATWRTDGSLPDDIDRLRCAVIYANDLDEPDAQVLVAAALARIRSTIEAEADGPSEPISERWVTVGDLKQLWMGRPRRHHFNDARYTVHTFELDDLYALTIALKMDEDFNEFDAWEMEHLDRCCVRMFDDPFARLRYHRAHMPTQESGIILHTWERFRTEVLDAR